MTLTGRYRKKPITVEANQWQPGTNIRGLRARYLDGVGHVAWFNDSDGEPHKVTPGDWIVRDNDGEMHVMSDSKFRALHDEADSSAAAFACPCGGSLVHFNLSQCVSCKEQWLGPQINETPTKEKAHG